VAKKPPAKTKPAAKPAKPAKKPVAPAKPVAKTMAKTPPKPTTKPTSKPSSKPAPKPTAKLPAKLASKPATAKPPAKPASKPVAAKPPAKAPAKPDPKAAKSDPKAEAKADPKLSPQAAPGANGLSASGRKGITIVSPKPMKKAKKPSPSVAIPPGLGRLLDPKGPIRKPLIPSGPKATSSRPLGQHGGYEQEHTEIEAKTPFNKKELEHFRTLLLKKRAELAGDVAEMEKEALRADSGSLSNAPSHMAEQGSETYDQTLSLDLAAADRKMIREIDDALKRIENGTFGICEATGKPIKLERLEELPWARYSIEAAREIERHTMRN
jgi:DnaK suppressor protein